MNPSQSACQAPQGVGVASPLERPLGALLCSRYWGWNACDGLISLYSMSSIASGGGRGRKGVQGGQGGDEGVATLLHARTLAPTSTSQHTAECSLGGADPEGPVHGRTFLSFSHGPPRGSWYLLFICSKPDYAKYIDIFRNILSYV